MKIHAFNGRAEDARGAAIALGVMDGVHRGHQAVLADARRHGPKLAAAVFEPHPRSHFQPDAPPFRLQTAAQRARTLAAYGADYVFEIPFDAAIAELSDEDFARKLLAEQIGASHVSVGHDFRYGKSRTGDTAALARQGAALGFTVSVVPPLLEDGLRISSTAIRTALTEGRVADATSLLSRPFAIEGEVVHGAQRGRTIGFPTANVALGDYLRPKFGVYAVRALIDNVAVKGVANIGVKPTVGGAPAPLLEAHLFDYAGDLYVKTIETQLIAFLRDERKFESFDALKEQILRDADSARAALA